MKAYVCILNIDTISTAQSDEDEDISTTWVALEEVRKMVKESKIKDMGFLAALSLVDHP